MRYVRAPDESIQAFDKRTQKATATDVVVLDAKMFSMEHRCEGVTRRRDGYHRCLDLKGHSGRHEYSSVAFPTKEATRYP